MLYTAVRYAFICFLCSGLFYKAQGQILFTESFNVIIDTSKVIKGSIMPDFKFQTQKDNLVEFENLADISFRINKKSAMTIANKIELSKFGKQTFLSGGYLYTEYRRILEHKMSIEPYGQVHWAEARGMELKYALGTNLRFRIYTKNKTGFFAGIGPFYEYERWNNKGVPDGVPVNLNQVIEQENVKLGTYLSFKWNAASNLFVDLSAYHQSRFDQIFSTPRLASSALVRINLTQNLGFNMVHQYIYDYRPVVPIRKDFHKIMLGFSINF